MITYEKAMSRLAHAKLRFYRVHVQAQGAIAKVKKKKKALELLGNACQVCGATSRLIIRCRLPEYLTFKPDEKYDKVIQDPASFTLLCRDCQKEVIRLEKLLSRFSTLKYLPFMRTKAKKLVCKYVENTTML